MVLLILNNRLNWQQLLCARSLGQHGLKLGVDNVYLVKATYTYALTLRMQAVAALGSAVGTSNKAINQVTAHIVGGLPGWVLRETAPAANYLVLAELVVADALVAGNVPNYLVALAFQESLQLCGLLEDVVVVAATHTAVRSDHENGCDVSVFALTQHVMLQRRGGSQLIHDAGHLSRIRLRCFYPGLRLGNARGSNKLLGLGDLLSRINGPDAVT